MCSTSTTGPTWCSSWRGREPTGCSPRSAIAWRPAAAVELLETSNQASTAALNLGGRDSANTICGNAGQNILYGMGGNDCWWGFAGDAYPVGGTGADVMYGGTGAPFYDADGNGAGAGVQLASPRWRCTPGISWWSDEAGHASVAVSRRADRTR